jgi:hypothetical protein
VQQPARGAEVLGPWLPEVVQHGAPVAALACARLPAAPKREARRPGAAEVRAPWLRAPAQHGREAPAALNAQPRAAASDEQLEQQWERAEVRARKFPRVVQQGPPGLVVTGERQQAAPDAVRWLQEASLGQAPAVSRRRRGRRLPLARRESPAGGA